ncbi:hypothetical protein RJ639_010338 [Escallonia herrerae]|uniref:Uncharacterized protein n=1 Tax=Escallonia herrerae TaxID=1293975 RepID=A0AA88VT72_9ASTE|nr:hypothetical protein RJ639_010338 [Escallonia herrerae]
MARRATAGERGLREREAAFGGGMGIHSELATLNEVKIKGKVSQFMSRAARLNEAFSIVKRVPVIRPSMPAAGVTPWPVMSLR